MLCWQEASRIPTRVLGRTGLVVSRLGLGTAEIGFAYGLGKRSLPDEKEAIRLLNIAVGMGITYFDTAAFYGLAEERIGKSGIAKNPGVVIGTKCGSFLDKGERPESAEVERRIRKEVEDSLRILKLDVLPLLMLHGGSAEDITGRELTDILQKFKDEGKALHVGISTRGEEAALAAVSGGFFEVVQTAYSIIDQRMSRRVLPLAYSNGVGIINRSVLLKGVLSGAVLNYPPILQPLASVASQVYDLAARYGVDLPTFAIRFALSNPFISTILIGTNNLGHLSSAVRAAERGPLPYGLVAEMETLALSDPNQVDPARWPKF
ncbi:MAG: aldo/keto reductase [Candidatus Sungiibacteriota bacterium]|uniref:Aldo/keto reductase n=1 Tax=Candidatus Sungiibacteriota bacterium TaxID=2750080 RepID=A0A7T5UQ31_9BACT|nr:MAG: aldo/keto reductase [Candidatus Sungbacteria bacterium]